MMGVSVYYRVQNILPSNLQIPRFMRERLQNIRKPSAEINSILIVNILEIFSSKPTWHCQGLQMRFFPLSPHYSGNRRSYGNFQPADELMVRKLKRKKKKRIWKWRSNMECHQIFVPRCKETPNVIRPLRKRLSELNNARRKIPGVVDILLLIEVRTECQPLVLLIVSH